VATLVNVNRDPKKDAAVSAEDVALTFSRPVELSPDEEVAAVRAKLRLK
jgi:hypothetical protein